MADFFTQDASRAYDQKNSRLAAIADCLHFLTRLALQGLPENARILCVGVGTGAEILSLSREYPGWRFVGVDPSAAMLEVCRERLKQAGVTERCDLVHGYVQDVAQEESFDAVLGILVGHFVKREDRPGFYRQMHARLKSGGTLVDAQISFDLESELFPSMLTVWERVQGYMGATPESLKTLPETLRNVLTVLAPAEVEAMMRASGFQLPVRFFQAAMIMGWFAMKDPAAR
jgi:tRNA (cmo5U34)-methyltransferase